MDCDTDCQMPVDTSEMLDLKPEPEPKPPSKETPQAPVVRQQLPIVSQQSTNPATESPPEAPTVGKFGWTSAEETIKPLPFVTRISDCYIAKEICQSQILEMFYLFPNAITDSDEYMDVAKMTSSEAYTFNEVNITHCDKGLVGNYSFKPGDILFNLKDIKAYIKFLMAFSNAVKYRKMQNDIFGFMKINNEKNTVPFVWNEGKQLMPTFYFFGTDEFLKEKCTYITDKWLCLYLRVCFILQKVKTEHYNPKSLQVVDVKYIKPLLSPHTIYTLTWPEDGYKHENFVSLIESNDQSPEALLAIMHGMTGLPQSPTKKRNPKKTRSHVNTVPATTPPSNMNSPNFLLNPQQSSAATYQMPRNNWPMRSQPFTCTSPSCRTCFRRPNVVTTTYYPTPVPTTTKQIPATNTHVTNTQSKRRRVRKNSKDTDNIPFKQPRKLLPAAVPQNMPISSSTNRLSNVPYASPQSASSPELQLPSPIISGASGAFASGDPGNFTYTNESVSSDLRSPTNTNELVGRDPRNPNYTNVSASRDPRIPSYNNVTASRDPRTPSYTNVTASRDPRTPSYTNVSARMDSLFPSYTNDHVRWDPCPPSYTNESERSGYQNSSDPKDKDLQALQNQRRRRLAAFYSYHQLPMQQQSLPQTVIVSSAGYYSAGFNNGAVVSTTAHLTENVIVTSGSGGYYSAEYNNNNNNNNRIFQNASLAQSVIVNPGGYYMQSNDPIYLPGSVTSSRTTGAFGGIENIL